MQAFDHMSSHVLAPYRTFHAARVGAGLSRGNLPIIPHVTLDPRNPKMTSLSLDIHAPKEAFVYFRDSLVL